MANFFEALCLALSLTVMGACGEAVEGTPEAGLPDSGPVCAHDLCAAFDESTDPTTGWTAVKQMEGCTYASFIGDYVSAPRSLQLRCNATGNGGHVQLNFTRPANGKSRVRLEFDYKLLGYLFADGSQALSYFGISDNGISQIALVHGANTGWFVNVAHSGSNGPTAIGIGAPLTPPLNTWTRLAIDVVLSTHDGAISLTWNGTTEAARRSGFGTTSDTSLTTLGIDLGLGSIGATSPEVTMLIDNLTLDLL